MGVFHLAGGARAGCAEIEPFDADHAEVLNIDTYPGYAGMQRVRGMVLEQPSSAGVNFTGVLTGLEQNTTGGWHIHSGYSCQAHAAVFGHYMAVDGSTDPWLTPVPTTWISDGTGVAPVESDVSQVTMYKSQPVYGRVFVVHQSSAFSGSPRVGCGSQSLIPPVFSPPPPPANPPMPPLNPGGSIEYQVRMSFIANGTVDAFDVESFVVNLASFLSVDGRLLEVSIEAGSVLIFVVLKSEDRAVAMEASRRVRELVNRPAAAEAALGIPIIVLSVSDPESVAKYPGGGANGAVIAVAIVLPLLFFGAVLYYSKFGVPDWIDKRRREAKKKSITIGLEQAIQQGVIDQHMKKKNAKRNSGTFKTGPPVDQIETVVLTSTREEDKPSPPPGPPPRGPGPPPGPPPSLPVKIASRRPPGPPPGPPPEYSGQELAANQA